MNRIGLRRENKNEWERRTPLVPQDIVDLVAQGLEVVVQTSKVRAFKDVLYSSAGADVRDDLGEASVILGVKEVAIEFIDRPAAYVFFSHTMKGQLQNMPMLARLMEVGASLFDYELITDDDGRRLVFFGRHAGYAGALESLYALRKKHEIQDLPTPLSRIDQPFRYRDLDEALADVDKARQGILDEGYPEERGPVTIAVMGYGNVSEGVQQVLNRLGVKWVEPGDLEKCAKNGDLNTTYAALFKEEDMAEPKNEDHDFDLQEFYDYPERFRSRVEGYLPHLTMLVSAYYWEPRFPVYVPRASLRKLAARGELRLEVIGDITCDIDGSIEPTNRPSSPAAPVYTYDPYDDEWSEGVDPRGVSIMAVDNLPCELSVDASRHFSQALRPFVPALAALDLNAKSLSESGLPPVLERACILWRGELTERFQYLTDALDASSRR